MPSLTSAELHDTGDSIRDDKLKGVKAIADFIDENERRVFYMLETGQLPAFKIGKIWHSTKTKLRALYAGEAA